KELIFRRDISLSLGGLQDPQLPPRGEPGQAQEDDDQQGSENDLSRFHRAISSCQWHTTSEPDALARASPARRAQVSFYALKPNTEDPCYLLHAFDRTIVGHVGQTVPVRVTEVNDIHSRNACFIQLHVIVLDVWSGAVHEGGTLQFGGDAPQIADQDSGLE